RSESGNARRHGACPEDGNRHRAKGASGGGRDRRPEAAACVRCRGISIHHLSAPPRVGITSQTETRRYLTVRRVFFVRSFSSGRRVGPWLVQAARALALGEGGLDGG